MFSVELTVNLSAELTPFIPDSSRRVKIRVHTMPHSEIVVLLTVEMCGYLDSCFSRVTTRGNGVFCGFGVSSFLLFKSS